MWKNDFSVDDVSEFFTVSIEYLWELLTVEKIHIIGAEQTDILIKKGLLAWHKAVNEKKVGWGLWIAEKP